MTADNTWTGPTRLAKHHSGPSKEKKNNSVHMCTCSDSDIRYTQTRIKTLKSILNWLTDWLTNCIVERWRNPHNQWYGWMLPSIRNWHRPIIRLIRISARKKFYCIRPIHNHQNTHSANESLPHTHTAHWCLPTGGRVRRVRL